MHCVVVVVVVVWRGISNCILTAPWGYKTNDKPSRAGTYICTRMYIMHIWIRMCVFKKLTSKISCSSVNKPKTTAASIDPYRMSNLATRCFCIRSMFPSPFTDTHSHTHHNMPSRSRSRSRSRTRLVAFYGIFRYPSVNNSFSSHSC